MATQFYEKVLPSQGVYCVTGIHKNGQVKNLFAETLDDVSKTIADLKEQQWNIFIALNTFDGYSRSAKNAKYCRAFYIDLDVGEDKPYSSKAQADEALSAFITDKELPPPVRVDSGNGLHAYWTFSTDVHTSEWKPYAEKFKAFCIDAGLHIDPVVTADAARVMRCPDTFNYKGDVPVPTKLLDEVIHSYSFEVFKDFLGPIELSPEEVLLSASKGLDDVTSAIISKHDNFETVFRDIAVKSMKGEGCNQIKYILEKAATLTEPMWYAGLSIARHCTDWETAIHLMSEDHPGYVHEATVKKANQSLNKPQGCGEFAKNNPAGCEGCPFKGKITNPLAIGRRLREPEPVESIEADEEPGPEEDPVREDPHPKKVQGLPEAIRPYARGVNGGIYYLPPPKVDKKGIKHEQDPILLLENDLLPIKRMFSAVDGMCMWIEHHLPKDPMKEFLLPLQCLTSMEEMKRRLAFNGVLFPQELAKQVYDYLCKWDVYLQNREIADTMRMQMGWTEDRRAFVAGLNEIDLNGAVTPTAASPLIRGLSKMIKPVGSYEVWQQSAKYFNEPGFELHAFGLLCGFGSPLMGLTSTPGASICFLSADSGTGKTGSLYGALSVFSDPYNISIMEGAATSNAFIGRYLGLKNILFGIDEASNVNPDTLSKLIHQISQGRAKIRMQSSVNAERETEMGAALLAMFTSNQSLYDKLSRYKLSPDGEMARLIEFSLKKPQQMADDDTLGKEIFDKFRFHYGHAGPRFIQYYFSKGEAYVRTLVDKWATRFARDLSGDSAYRFYQNAVAAILAGGELANEAGIINYDLERIYSKVINELIQLRTGTVKINEIDYTGIIQEFLDNNHPGTLIVDEGRVISEPRTALICRKERDTNRVYVSYTAFRKYLLEAQISTREFEWNAQKAGVLIAKKKHRLSKGWKGGTVSPAGVSTYEFAIAVDTNTPADAV